ncbi:MAG: hypothetical protein KDA68_21190, partial [Planctomycetaceae bacterium]|nr:hypothetical protein [Planctomycetaceae bacterium]
KSSIGIRYTEQVESMLFCVPDQQSEIPSNVVKPATPGIPTDPRDDRFKVAAEQCLHKVLTDIDRFLLRSRKSLVSTS